MIFVDSNIPMYVAGKDHPHKEPARRFLDRARGGGVEICTNTEVLQEILHRYVGLKRPDLAREIYDLFLELCPTVLAVTLADTNRARQMLDGVSGVSVRDAIHAAVMLNNDIREIATFDGAFDHIEGVRRVRLDATLV